MKDSTIAWRERCTCGAEYEVTVTDDAARPEGYEPAVLMKWRRLHAKTHPATYEVAEA